MTKERKLDDDNEPAVAGTSYGSTTHSTVSVSSETVMSQCNEDHLSFGKFDSRRDHWIFQLT
jgi:hypothetical protein